jgi:glycine oxidase
MRGQMLCFHSERRLVRHVVYGTDCYIVPRRDGRILVGATVEDVGFDRSMTEEAVKSLHDSGLEMIPALGNVKMRETWCGFRPFASDGLPVLGGVSGIENLALATGHFRNGILLAPLTGSVIADHLFGTDSPYLGLYGMSRFASRSAGSA